MAEPVYDKSKFSLSYFLAPKKQDAFKALKYGFTFLLILGAGYLIYRGAEALFPKPKQQNIVAKKGSVVTVIQEGDKRILTPFVEVYGDTNTDMKGEGRVGIGGRIGCRIEF